MLRIVVDLGRYYWGVGTSLPTLMAGGWLMMAPFALGYQPGGAAWTTATKDDFGVGLGVVVVSLTGMILFARSLIGDLQAAGVIERRPQPQPPAPSVSPPVAAPVPASPYHDEFERTIATLAAAPASDIAERRAARQPNSAQPAPASEKEHAG